MCHSSCSSCSSSRTSTCSSLYWSSQVIQLPPSCSQRSSSSHRRRRANRVSNPSILIPCIEPAYFLLSLIMIFNRPLASPESSNSTTSKSSQPPAESAKHHSCHTGQKTPNPEKHKHVSENFLSYFLCIPLAI